MDATRKLRRRISPGTAGGSDSRAAGEHQDRQPAALRRKLKRARADLESVRSELRATRASVRDPNPGVVISERLDQVVDSVLELKLTYLKKVDLLMLARLVRETEESGRPGLIIEAGAARGGSAIVLGAAKSPERRLNVYDVFGMIPPPSDSDGPDVHARYDKIVRGESRGVGGETYYGYREDLYDEVTASFASMGVPVEANNVSLVRGLFQDTVDIDEPVAVAHLDGDWYESTMTCLERIAPHLVPDGRIVLDDYYAWSGCRRAVDEYFAGRPGFQVEMRSKVHVVRL